jgi:hypothetical protein
MMIESKPTRCAMSERWRKANPCERRESEARLDAGREPSRADLQQLVHKIKNLGQLEEPREVVVYENQGKDGEDHVILGQLSEERESVILLVFRIL